MSIRKEVTDSLDKMGYNYEVTKLHDGGNLLKVKTSGSHISFYDCLYDVNPDGKIFVRQQDKFIIAYITEDLLFLTIHGSVNT